MTDVGPEIQQVLAEKTGLQTVPNIFIYGEHIGGSDKLIELKQNEELLPLLYKRTHNYDYDYVSLTVIIRSFLSYSPTLISWFYFV